jgi:hypothetical protein
MPSLPQNNVTIVVIEMEPGWVYVKMIDPKPAPEQIEIFLRRAIDDWFNARPESVIDRSQTVIDHGTMQGVHVWYHVSDRRPEPMSPPPPKPASLMSIEIHGLVSQQLPKEHIEAVVEDAMKLLHADQDRPDTLVVINRRRIAVVLDKQENRGTMLPLHLVERVMDASLRKQLHTWLESLPTRFFATHIPGSWFVSRDIEATGIKTAEPASMIASMAYDTGSMRPARIYDTSLIRTKMTYDPGPRPKE